MAKEESLNIKDKIIKPKHREVYKNSSGAIYSLGIIGAAVYYIIHATSFWIGLLGIIKAILWPAFLIFKVFDLLKM